MKGTIRKGSSQDAAAILAVMEDVYEASPWKLEQIEADLEQELTSYFLAVDGGQVLGFVAIQETLYEAELLQIAVKRAFQGQGLAQQLLAQLPDQKEIFLEVRVSNQPAQGPGGQHYRPGGTPGGEEGAHEAQDHPLPIALRPPQNASDTMKHLSSPPFPRK